LADDNKFGFIVMDGNGALFGTLSGNTREVLHKFTVDLPKKHGMYLLKEPEKQAPYINHLLALPKIASSQMHNATLMKENHRNCEIHSKIYLSSLANPDQIST
jgi:hypothetical protein